MSFLVRILLVSGQILVYAVVGSLVILAVIFVLNKLIQFVASIFGQEVGDFISWFFGGLKKLLKKKKKKNL